MRPHARLATGFVPVLLALGGCSVLVNPNEALLRPEGGVADGQPDRVTPVDGGDVPVTPPPDARDVPVTPPPDASDVPIVPRDVSDVPTPGCTGSCDDGIPCTTDRCNAAAGRCEHTADNTLCSGGTVCDLTMGCVMRPCNSDAQCTDGNACNGTERCTGMHCVAGTPPRCDDGQYCNGVETCNPTMGCQPGVRPTCDDGTVCTRDRCNPDAAMATGACENAPVDADGDTFPAASVMGTMCAGGTDCNDANGAISPRAVEVCNGVDDNCNGMIDEGLTCAPPNDACDRPTALTVVSGMTTVMGTTVGAMDGLTSTCGRTGGGDVWFAITYPAANDLRVDATPMAGAANDPVLVLRDTCTSRDLACNDDAALAARTSRIWVRPTVPTTVSMRTLLFAVDAYQPGAEGAFALRVETTSPLPAPSCAGALFDVTLGGTVYGYLRPGASTTSGTCTPMSTVERPEDIYLFNGGAGTLDLTVTPLAGFTPSLYVRRGVCATGTEIGCDNGTPASLRAAHVAGMASYIFVDNGPIAGGRYALGVIAP